MGNAHAEPLFDLLKMSVVLTTQIGQALIILGIEEEGDGLGGVVQSGTGASNEADRIITELNGSSVTTSARRELGNASVIRTSTNSPICWQTPVKLTTRLFSVRPLS